MADLAAHYIEQVVPLATSFRGKVLEGECARLLPDLAGKLEDCLEDLGMERILTIPEECTKGREYIGTALWTDGQGRLMYGGKWLAQIQRIKALVRPLMLGVNGLGSGAGQPGGHQTAGADRQLAAEPPAIREPRPEYVTLDQMTAFVNRAKKTLERKLSDPNSGMPPPVVEGGGGKPHEWLWAEVRPWLERTFGRRLPEQFPRC